MISNIRKKLISDRMDLEEADLEKEILMFNTREILLIHMKKLFTGKEGLIVMMEPKTKALPNGSQMMIKMMITMWVNLKMIEVIFQATRL